MTGKPMGAAFFNSNYYYFGSWKPETWISFCVSVDNDGRYAILYSRVEQLFDH